MTYLIKINHTQKNSEGIYLTKGDLKDIIIKCNKQTSFESWFKGTSFKITINSFTVISETIRNLNNG